MGNSTFGVEPGARAYMRAARLSWWIGLAAALILFTVVPHWYFGLPLALLGFWLTNSLCGMLWYEVREALACEDRLHRSLAGFILIIAFLIGTAAFCLIPNWSDFDFNGHPSLVALAGSLVMGVLAFTIAGGVVAALGVPIKLFVLRIVDRTAHGKPS